MDPQLLGERAMHCRAYAKALHYKEDEFHKEPNNQVFEALISINNKLQQKEAAAGKWYHWNKIVGLRGNVNLTMVNILTVELSVVIVRYLALCRPAGVCDESPRFRPEGARAVV